MEFTAWPDSEKTAARKLREKEALDYKLRGC